MNPVASEGILLTQLHRTQYNCRQGLIADKELIGFVRTVREIRSCIDHPQAYRDSSSWGLDISGQARNLALSFAILKAKTHLNTYSIKGTLRDSSYVGPRTSIIYTVEYGLTVSRDESETSWSDYVYTGFGGCYFLIANTNGDEFGPILEHLKEIIYWDSTHFSINDKTNAHILTFDCDLQRATKRFQKPRLWLAVKS